MTLREYAKQEGITLAEAKERTGLTHWNQKLLPTAPPPLAVEEDTVSLYEFAEEVIEDVKQTLDDPELLVEALSLMGLIGWKTRAFLHFVNDNKDRLPVEYERVRHLIEKYLCV